MIWLKICSFASDKICCTFYGVVKFKNDNPEKQETNLVKTKVNTLKLKVLFENIYDSSSLFKFPMDCLKLLFGSHKKIYGTFQVR